MLLMSSSTSNLIYKVLGYFGIIFLFAFQAAFSMGIFSPRKNESQKGKMIIVVTVDWEGRELAEKDLKAIQFFRKLTPKISMLHFLNAAYYTKPGADAASITKKIKSIVKEGDEIGLHLHPWKTLTDASGAKFQTTPNLGGWGTKKCDYDCGYSVSLEAYSTKDVRKILKKSMDILTKEGFQRPESFRAGGWQAGPKVMEALVQEKFKMDSSAITPVFFYKHLFLLWNGNLIKYVKKFHPGITTTSQPYKKKIGKNFIWELPNNGGLVDFTSTWLIMNIIRKNAKIFLKNPGKNHYVTLGFHVEGASKYLPRLEEAISKIILYSNSKGIPIEFAKFPLEIISD